MATTPENPPNPTPDAAAITPNVSDKKFEKKPSKKSEKPIYENFRHKSQTSTLSWLKNVGNKLIPWPKKNKVKVAGEDDPEVDAVVDEELDEKIDGSEPAREVYGFDYEVLWLVRLLVKPEKKDFNFKRIGVVGMPDIGKSDVGRLIFNHESVKQHFAPRIWVPMAGKSTKDVVIHILKELEVDQELIEKWGKGTGADDIQADGGETEKKGVDALLYALNLKLVGKRYLIILDDVEEWTDKVEEENGTSAAPAPAAPAPAPAAGTEKAELICDPFKFGFPKESGGAVLVTSRKKSVVKGMVDDNIYTPQPIKNADSNWDIYNSVLKRKIEFPTEDLKNEFKKKSGGLPVAARLMGKIKNKIIEEENEAGTDGSNRTTENGEGTNRNNKTTENVAGTVGNSKTMENVAGTVGNNNTEQNGGVN